MVRLLCMTGLWAAVLVAEAAQFDLPLPPGWAYEESDSGFVATAPDAGIEVALRVETGGLGPMSVRGYLTAMLWREGLGDARLLVLRTLPPLPGPAAQVWEPVEADYVFHREGRAYRFRALCALLGRGSGVYAAVVRTATAPLAAWREAASRLTDLHAAVTVARRGPLAGLAATPLPGFGQWADVAASAAASSVSPSAR